ncbi:MAG: RRXRR domain-containing protein [Nanoarchaeota archaeon]|nr:RRXRR domain-containing protein [Nanoarchaeota archaeon]
MQLKTTRNELKAPENASLILCSAKESLNLKSLETTENISENSMLVSHLGSGYNLNESSASMSGRIFVLSFTGKPLTPCKPQKARKLLIGGVAKVVWNKFGEFGIQMLIPTREEIPKTVLGIDTGTKFEGLSLIVGKENKLNIMWLLPDKKTIVNKLELRRQLRRARRWRTCRRRVCRFDNKSREGFIAPSQLMMVQSRLKAINEFFKCYPINKVAIEDVKFNHRDNKWGKNFSTIEIGKNMIKAFIIGKVGRDNYITFEGFETEQIRNKLVLKKSSNKASETFNSHCVDSFSIASELSNAEPNFNIKVVDDTYRPTRRRLHDTQPKKGNIREKYSTGNFKGIRKGTICEFGQIVGGTKKTHFIRNSDNKRIGRTNVNWMSHNFKLKTEAFFLPTINGLGIQNARFK